MSHHESSWVIMSHHESLWVIMIHHDWLKFYLCVLVRPPESSPVFKTKSYESSWIIVIIMSHCESSWVIMTDDSIEIFFLKFYFCVLVGLKFEFGYDIYIIRKLMKNSIALGSYMLKKSIFKEKIFCLSMALSFHFL